MSSFILPKKQILYAPMLASFGGGSARGFNPGGGGGAIDGSVQYTSSLTGQTVPGSLSDFTANNTGTLSSIVSFGGSGRIQFSPLEDVTVDLDLIAPNRGSLGLESARVRGRFTMLSGVTYYAVVGNKASYDFAGNGAVCLYTTTSAQPVAVAGGAAGAGEGPSAGSTIGSASTSTAGNNGFVGGTYNVLYAGKGGINGGGGGTGVAQDNSARGGNGGNASDGESASSIPGTSANAGSGGGAFFGAGGSSATTGSGGPLIYAGSSLGTETTYGGGGRGQSGGGGGGGYSGGGGGSWNSSWTAANGGGGSCYLNASVTNNNISLSTVNAVNGSIKLTVVV